MNRFNCSPSGLGFFGIDRFAVGESLADDGCGMMEQTARATYELTAPPSTNNLYVNTSRGRRISTAYKAWQAKAGWELRIARAAPLECKRFGMEIRLPEGAVDIDNIKALPDLFGPAADVDHPHRHGMGLTPDDRHLAELHVYRDHTLARGRCRVTVWPM